VEWLNPRPGWKTLDVAGGTGDIAFRIIEMARSRGGEAAVTVCDTGHGIERANLAAIFEPFFTTKGERGTGLGLWVTRGIVEEQGGKLQLRSNTAGRCHGTVVRVLLPVAQAAEKPAAPNVLVDISQGSS